MKPILTLRAPISHFMTYGGPEFIKMIQKNNKMTCIIFFFTCVGQGATGLDSLLTRGEDNQGGGQDFPGQFAPWGQANRG